MCTVVGVVSRGINREVARVISDILPIRGRDIFGIETIDGRGSRDNLPLPSYKIYDLLVDSPISVLQSRAIPETEERCNALICSKYGIAPSVYKDVVVAHNGIIYNDRELLSEVEDRAEIDKMIRENVYVDSVIIPRLLYKYKNEKIGKPSILGYIKTIENVFNGKIKGSYACVIMFKKCKEALFFITNYLSMFCYIINDENIIVTNIEPDYINYPYYYIPPNSVGFTMFNNEKPLVDWVRLC